MRQHNVTIYGSMACPDTTRTMGWLDSQGIAYEFKDVDASPEYNDYIADLNGGKRVMPTIQVDNEVLINPGEGQLAKAVRGEATPK